MFNADAHCTNILLGGVDLVLQIAICAREVAQILARFGQPGLVLCQRFALGDGRSIKRLDAFRERPECRINAADQSAVVFRCRPRAIQIVRELAHRGLPGLDAFRGLFAGFIQR